MPTSICKHYVKEKDTWSEYSDSMQVANNCHLFQMMLPGLGWMSSIKSYTIQFSDLVLCSRSLLLNSKKSDPRFGFTIPGREKIMCTLPFWLCLNEICILYMCVTKESTRWFWFCIIRNRNAMIVMFVGLFLVNNLDHTNVWSVNFLLLHYELMVHWCSWFLVSLLVLYWYHTNLGLRIFCITQKSSLRLVPSFLFIFTIWKLWWYFVEYIAIKEPISLVVRKKAALKGNPGSQWKQPHVFWIWENQKWNCIMKIKNATFPFL